MFLSVLSHLMWHIHSCRCTQTHKVYSKQNAVTLLSPALTTPTHTAPFHLCSFASCDVPPSLTAALNFPPNETKLRGFRDNCVSDHKSVSPRHALSYGMVYRHNKWSEARSEGGGFSLSKCCFRANWLSSSCKEEPCRNKGLANVVTVAMEMSFCLDFYVWSQYRWLMVFPFVCYLRLLSLWFLNQIKYIYFILL